MGQVYLRALEIGDLDRTHKWHNDRELYKNLIGTFHFSSRAAEEKWLSEKQVFSQKEINLAICLKENSQHIGNFYIKNIDWTARNAMLGALIGEKSLQGKGYGTEAHHLIAKYAFQDLGLNRLWVQVLEDNTQSLKHLEKCGYTVEGRFRKHALKNGQFKDVILLGICAGDDISQSG